MLCQTFPVLYCRFSFTSIHHEGAQEVGNTQVLKNYYLTKVHIQSILLSKKVVANGGRVGRKVIYESAELEGT
jgi:hypothetical protein